MQRSKEIGLIDMSSTQNPAGRYVPGTYDPELPSEKERWRRQRVVYPVFGIGVPFAVLLADGFAHGPVAWWVSVVAIAWLLLGIFWFGLIAYVRNGRLMRRAAQDLRALMCTDGSGARGH